MNNIKKQFNSEEIKGHNTIGFSHNSSKLFFDIKINLRIVSSI